jgi:hypothetical protein
MISYLRTRTKWRSRYLTISFPMQPNRALKRPRNGRPGLRTLSLSSAPLQSAQLQCHVLPVAVQHLRLINPIRF